jgi:hypothetical protein
LALARIEEPNDKRRKVYRQPRTRLDGATKVWLKDRRRETTAPAVTGGEIINAFLADHLAASPGPTAVAGTAVANGFVATSGD